MSVPRRLCLLLFALCAAFCLAALTLPWFGPWTEQAAGMLSVRWYYLAVELALCVTVLGVLVVLLRALLTPRRRRVVEVGRVGGDVITVAVAAIASQATHAVAHDGRFVAEKVRVRARKRSADVFVRVRPSRAVNVAEAGPQLRDALLASIAGLMGEAIHGVSLEFVDPSFRDDESLTYAGTDTVDDADERYRHDMGGAAPVTGGPDGITVSLKGGSGDAAESDLAEGGE